MRTDQSIIAPGHTDYDVLNAIRTEIFRLAKGESNLKKAFPGMVQDSMDFVLDPVRTGRTELKLLDNVEKTFIGLKAEHFLRDFLDVPKGLRDLVIGGMDVDVKNTVRGNWMIPQESYSVSGACLLVSYDDELRQCSLGVFLARPEYLNAPNQDKKRSLSKAGRENILWLVEGADFPESHWAHFDMVRFRELRKMKGGTKRTSAFLRENLRKRIHRSVLQSLLFDQRDYMKRIRGNGGARDVLRKEQIAVLSGAYGKDALAQLSISGLQKDEAIAVAPLNTAEENVLRAADVID